MPNTQVLRLEHRLVRGLSMLSGRGDTKTHAENRLIGMGKHAGNTFFISVFRFPSIHTPFLSHAFLSHAFAGIQKYQKNTLPPYSIMLVPHHSKNLSSIPSCAKPPPTPQSFPSCHIFYTYRTNRNQSLPTVMQLHLIDIMHTYSFR